MLKKIRSNLILKKIFNIIDNKRKFNTIVYNKGIQKRLGLELTDFKRFSGRYLESSYETTREYNSITDRLIYEGGYGNNKRNGEGKEYNENRDLIFEGEYLNGKKWKGKYYEYDEDTHKLIL